MEIMEKVAYLKGLAEGMELDTATKEGKLFAAIVDILEDIAFDLEDLQDQVDEVMDGLDAVSDDLEDVEDLLFDEDDARVARPKVEAAAQKLARANSDCRLETRHIEANPRTLPELIDGCDLVLDATDNVRTRLNIDEACRRARLPWIYGGVLGTQGLMVPMPVGAPCLRCLFGEPPAPGLGNEIRQVVQVGGGEIVNGRETFH